MTQANIQLRGHCQCCGRLQAAIPSMAKHGYTVKDRGSYGYFAGTCSGSGHSAIEESRVIADACIKAARKDAVDQRAMAAELKAGTRTPATVKTNTYDPKARDFVYIAFAQADAYQQQKAIKLAIYKTESRAKQADAWADQHTALCLAWHGKPLTKVAKAEAPEEILNGQQRVGSRGTLTATSVYRGMVRWVDAKGFKGSMSTRSWRLLAKA